MKKAILVVMLAAFAASSVAPAFAADKKCKKGTVLDAKTKKCVKAPAKKQ